MVEFHLEGKAPTRTSPGFTFVDMPFSNRLLDSGKATLTSRYPEFGYNEFSSDLLVTILSGNVFIYTEYEYSERFSKWDTVFIPKGTKYYWIPDSREVIMQATFFHEKS